MGCFSIYFFPLPKKKSLLNSPNIFFFSVWFHKIAICITRFRFPSRRDSACRHCSMRPLLLLLHHHHHHLLYHHHHHHRHHNHHYHHLQHHHHHLHIPHLRKARVPSASKPSPIPCTITEEGF